MSDKIKILMFFFISTFIHVVPAQGQEVEISCLSKILSVKTDLTGLHVIYRLTFNDNESEFKILYPTPSYTEEHRTGYVVYERVFDTTYATSMSAMLNGNEVDIRFDKTYTSGCLESNLDGDEFLSIRILSDQEDDENENADG